jgi:hypothetical protein
MKKKISKPSAVRNTGRERLGSSFETFLVEKGIAQEVNATAVKRVRAWQRQNSKQRCEIEIPDKTLFELDADAFAKFQKVLDAPAAPSNKLRRFLTGKSPWDRR